MNGTDLLKAFDTKQQAAQIMMQLSAFQSGWNSGLILFGLHLMILGYLVFKSVYFPKFLGVLVAIAGLGYLIDSLGKILIPDYKLTIAMTTFIGEVLLIFWLLWKGIKGFGKEIYSSDNEMPTV